MGGFMFSQSSLLGGFQTCAKKGGWGVDCTWEQTPKAERPPHTWSHIYLHIHEITKCKNPHAATATALENTAPMGWPGCLVAACLSFPSNLFCLEHFSHPPLAAFRPCSYTVSSVSLSLVTYVNSSSVQDFHGVVLTPSPPLRSFARDLARSACSAPALPIQTHRCHLHATVLVRIRNSFLLRWGQNLGLP